ncbi:glycosyltransferase family 2 protein [Helicobacter canis]|uniref:Glycosyltransferase family 2 protein n=1 Tax=Helicobacter canis TaxID=29419 RepID=A0A5M9QIM7_9HELI|nr:glycosyltransferase family 2 protein [Helicobacter canis]
MSIIIPTYNVESYIVRCLESCINQTLRDIEILVIDDCGSDSSIQIAQHYAQRDCRIRIIHNANNLGTFATRIVGIRQARGEYVLFVDADDYLHLQACETLHQHATLHNADILHFKAHYPANPHTPLLAKLTHYARYALPTRFSKKSLQNHQIAQNFFLDSRQFPKFTLWDKCYDSELLRQACGHFTDSSFTPIVADDLLFFLVIASLATSYISIDKRLYFYCLNAQSSMHNPSKRARRIESFSYVANALHTLELDSSLLPQITRTMSQDLAALIILESRLLDSRASTPSSAQSAKIARRGGGSARIYTSSAHAPCRSWAYPSTQDSSIYALDQIALSALLCAISAVLGTLPYLYSHFCLYLKPRQNQALVFTKVNSALGNHSADFGDFLKKHRLAASGIPCFRATADLNQTELDSSVDCHDLPSKSRNDDKAQNLNKSAKDSRSFTQNAKNLTTLQAEAKLDSSKSPSDSKILELESGFFEPRAEIRLGGLSHKRGDEIHDSSPKAESLLKVAYAA